MIIISCSSSGQVEIKSLEFRVAETEPADSLEERAMKYTGQVFYLHKKSELSEAHIVATKMVDWNDSEAIELKFNDEGTRLLAELTRNNIGKRIGMVLNGELVTAPIVQAEIPNGTALIPLLRRDSKDN
jgi:preprotein translocase subunit SecD